MKCLEDTSEETCDADDVYVVLQNQRWGKRFEAVLYFRNVIRLDGARVRVTACLSLRKGGLSLRHFLRNKCSAALPVDHRNRTISVESTDGNLLMPLAIVWILRLRMSRNFEDIYFYERLILLNYSMEQSPALEANWFCSESRNSPHFMEPESSSPYSQVPAICPYPEPTPPSLHPLPLPEDPC